MKHTSRGRPEWPPKRVWREVDEAAQAWDDLHAQGCEIHFEVDEQSGRLNIEMRDVSDGSVVRTLSPSQVVAIASGAAVR